MPGKDSKTLPGRPHTSKQARALIRNKITLFDEDVLDKLDSYINMGFGAASCLKNLKLSPLSAKIIMPSRDTMERYIAVRRPQLDNAVEKQLEAERQIMMLNPIPDIRTVDSKDKRKMLDVILRKLGYRVEIVEDILDSLSGGSADARYEKILAEALAEMRETIAMQVKLDEKLGFERDRLQAVVNVLLGHISSSVSQAYKDIHGDEKLEPFVKSLEKRLDTLPFEVIESEVMAVITENAAVVDTPEVK
jgi:hypothetical protein